MAETIAQLRALSDEQLISRHDAQAEHMSTGVSFYLEELSRRQNTAATQAAARDAHAVLVLTRWIAGLTFINVAAACALLIDAT